MSCTLADLVNFLLEKQKFPASKTEEKNYLINITKAKDSDYKKLKEVFHDIEELDKIPGTKKCTPYNDALRALCKKEGFEVKESKESKDEKTEENIQDLVNDFDEKLKLSHSEDDITKKEKKEKKLKEVVKEETKEEKKEKKPKEETKEVVKDEKKPKEETKEEDDTDSKILHLIEAYLKTGNYAANLKKISKEKCNKKQLHIVNLIEKHLDSVIEESKKKK